MARRVRFVVAVLQTVGILLVGLPATVARASSVPVVLIFEENHSFSQIVGNRSEAPYINQLIDSGMLGTQDFVLWNGSKPNYIAATSGQNTKGIKGPYGYENLFHQLRLADLSQKSYEETMPYPCFTKGKYGVDPNQYVKGHDPAVNYTNIVSDPTYCAATVVPSGAGGSQIVADANAGVLPAFSFVTPNNCSNMHSCSIRTADLWLSGVVPSLLGTGALVIVTWDEGSVDKHIPIVEVGPGVAAGSTFGTPINQYNLLAGLEDYFGLARLGNAVGAVPFPIP